MAWHGMAWHDLTGHAALAVPAVITARPIAGSINFCPHANNDLHFVDDIPVARELKLTTAVHELAHALGAQVTRLPSLPP